MLPLPFTRCAVVFARYEGKIIGKVDEAARDGLKKMLDEVTRNVDELANSGSAKSN
mgnify:FL=1